MTENAKGKGAVMAHDPLADLDPEAAPQAPAPEPQAVAQVPADTPGEAAAADAAEAAGVNLGDSLTIADVGELRERLRGELDLGGTLSIRAGEVAQLDAAGIQLLCAVARDARNQGLELAWDGVSARLESAVLQLGLQDELSF